MHAHYQEISLHTSVHKHLQAFNVLKLSLW